MEEHICKLMQCKTIDNFKSYLNISGLELDFEKVDAVGYKGRMRMKYKKDCFVCPGCDNYCSHEYDNHKCETHKFICYNCAIHGLDNPCC